MRRPPDRAAGSGARRRRGLYSPGQRLRHPQGRSRPAPHHGGGHHHRLQGAHAHHGAVLRGHRRHRSVCCEGLPSGGVRRGLRRHHREGGIAGGVPERVHQHQDLAEPRGGGGDERQVPDHAGRVRQEGRRHF